MRIQALLAATVLSASMLSVPTSANAQGNGAPYYHEGQAAQVQCEQQRRNRTATGAVLGGLAGVALGSGVAADGARTEGGLLAGLIGAVAGAAIARGGSCAPAAQNQHDPYSGRPYAERGQQRGPYGDPYARDPYSDGGHDDGDLYGGPEPRGPGGRF